MAASRRLPAWVGDWLLAVGVVAVDLALLWDRAATTRFVGDGPVPASVVVGMAALLIPLLALRRFAPGLVFGGVWGGTVAMHVLLPGYRATLPLVVALVAVCWQLSWRPATAALVAAGLVAPMAAAAEAADYAPDQRVEVWWSATLMYLLLFVACWAVGRWAGHSGRALLALEHRRESAEREARAAADDERRRIAHDLHDVVAHSVTVMVLQSAAARRTAGSADETTRVLADIEATGKQAIGELRQTLQLMGGLGAGSGPRASQPSGLADVDRVVAATRSAGWTVTVTPSGAPSQLDPAADLAAFRVIQEGLTNVMKHAGSEAQAEVRLRWSPADLVIEVANSRPAVRSHASGLSMGLGLAGLRERCKVAGGDLWAHDTDDGRFCLSARLPVSA